MTNMFTCWACKGDTDDETINIREKTFNQYKSHWKVCSLPCLEDLKIHLDKMDIQYSINYPMVE